MFDIHFKRWIEREMVDSYVAKHDDSSMAFHQLPALKEAYERLYGEPADIELWYSQRRQRQEFGYPEPSIWTEEEKVSLMASMLEQEGAREALANAVVPFFSIYSAS